MTPGPSDNCPACLAVTNPYRAEHDGLGTLTAYYKCRCGKKWWTSWLLTPAEMARYRPDAA